MVFPGVLFLIMWLQLIERLQVLQAQRAKEALSHFSWVIQRCHGVSFSTPATQGPHAKSQLDSSTRDKGSHSISLDKGSSSTQTTGKWHHGPGWGVLPGAEVLRKEKRKGRRGTNSGKLAVTENFPYSFHNSRWVLNVFQCKSENTNCFLKSLDGNLKPSKMRPSQDNSNSMKGEAQTPEDKRGKYSNVSSFTKCMPCLK